MLSPQETVTLILLISTIRYKFEALNTMLQQHQSTFVDGIANPKKQAYPRIRASCEYAIADARAIVSLAQERSLSTDEQSQSLLVGAHLRFYQLVGHTADIFGELNDLLLNEKDDEKLSRLRMLEAEIKSIETKNEEVWYLSRDSTVFD